MDRIIEHYLQNIFPKENRAKIPEYIIQLLKTKNFEDTSKTPVAMAYEIFKALKIVTEFIDKAERGFLTGDINLRLIHTINKSITELLGKLPANIDPNSASYHEKRDLLITECYDEIARVAFAGPFRLPVGGVRFPDYENPRNLFERQLLLEDESNEIAVDKFLSVYDDLENLGMSWNLKFAKSYIIEWFPNLTKAIKEEQEQCLLGDLKGDRKHYGSYLIKLSSEKVALLALTELMKSILKLTQKKKDDVDGSMHNYHIVSKVLFDAIGKAVNAQIIFDYEEELLKAREAQYQAANSPQATGEPDLDAPVKPQQKKKSNIAAKTAALAQRVLKKKLDSEVHQSIGMPKDVQLKLGSLIVYLMKETIKIKNQEGFWQNLLTTGYSKLKNKKQYVGVLNVNEEFLLSLVSKIEKTGSLFIQIERCLPMIFKPAPWQDHEIGGYYQKPTNFMRIQESVLQERSIKYADLQPTFNVLDILGQTPWRVNKNVLNAVEGIWESGGGAGEIPIRHYNYQNYIYEYQLKECKDYKERQKLMKKIQQQRDIHSLRCDFTLKLNVAKAFRNIEKIYFPHNVDFRGRVYPIPPHLNHMSSDICRGLLEFAEGKPIGPTGLRWLKIHLANKMGKDKLSMQDRILYVDSILPIVERCVKDPLRYREWLEVEDCWQTLAAMYDLWEAMNRDDPAEHISHLHIHQDGSCNGLQHYAALGRDYAGAEQVNLVARERPGDIYTAVANMVQERINMDAENPASKHHKLAKKLVGNVKRKIVKQTVMTSVYGVTFIGARAQIHKQLRDKDFLDQDDDKEVYDASHYIASYTLDCIRDLFSGAHEIKKWLITCAGLIANTANPVSWITPLGLPVVQPYRSKKQVDVISTIIQRVTISNNQDDVRFGLNLTNILASC